MAVVQLINNQPKFIKQFKTFKIRKQTLPRLTSIAVAVAISLTSHTLIAAETSNTTALKAEVSRLRQVISTLDPSAKDSQKSIETQSDAELQTEIDTLKKKIIATLTTQNVVVAQSAEATANNVQANPPEEESQVLDQITVRSRNRIELLKDVPLSVSVVSGTELEKLGAADLGTITKRAANVSWNQGNQRTSSLSIRGIGKIGQTEAQDPSVGIIVDGVNYAYNPLSSFNFTDVDTVEVTRGPQGTLLGKNTTLGVINITTKKPSFKPSADYSLTFGQQDTFQGRLAAGGPIIDNLLAWRGTIAVDKGAGDITNITNRDDTYQNTDRLAGRLQFLFTPTDNFDARFAFEVQPRSGENTNARTFYKPTPTTYANGTVNPLSSDASTRLARPWFNQQSTYNYQNNYLYGNGQYATNNDGQHPVVTGTRGTSAELNWKVANHTLTSITAYKDYHFNARYNDEGTPFDIQRSSGQDLLYKQTSQELRISSEPGGFVDYQGGLFLIKTTNDIQRNVIYGSDAGAWFASTAQYNRLNADGNGRYLMQNSLNQLWKAENQQNIQNKSAAAFGQANWHITDPFTVTTGVRFTREDRQNPGSSLIANDGYGRELNPVSVNGVQLGGFSSNATTGALAGTNSAAQLSLADTVANKYFGTPITATPGDAYNSLTSAQQRQVADAKAIRQTQMGVLWGKFDPQTFKKTQPAYVFSPTYKVNENLTTYVSWQYGEKAGISQIVNGTSTPAKAEKSSAYELGFKSVLLDKTLVFNADIFLLNIKDYQQAVQVFDAYTTANKNDGTLYYTAATGNVPKVQAKGLEIDGVYGGIPHTTIRFAGAYNKAIYKEFANSAQPEENKNLPAAYADVSGQQLPGAPKYSFNIGAEYRVPIFGNKEFHTSFNTSYFSRSNIDVALSEYGWLKAYSVTDFNIGLGTLNKSFDVSLLVKNLFDDKTNTVQTWNSYSPGVSRWIGLVFTGKL